MLRFSLDGGGQLFQQTFDLSLDVGFLSIRQAKLGQEQCHMPTARFGHTRSYVQWFSAKNLPPTFGGYLPNAILFEQRAELAGAKLLAELWRRSNLEQSPEPALFVDAAELENLREIALKLLAQPVAQRYALRF